jgi:phage gp45-like
MMSDSEIKQLIASEIKKQMNVILSGSSANADNISEDIQNMFPGQPTQPSRPTMHPYGFCSLAPNGTIQVVARQGDHFGNRLTLGHRAADRPKDLNGGESAVYSMGGYTFRLQNDSIMLGKGTTYETAVVGETLVQFLTMLIQEIIVHSHPAPGAGPVDAAAFEELQTEFLDNAKVLAKEGGRF